MRTVFAVLWTVIVLSTLGGRAQACSGDCDGNGSVAISELVLMVNIAIGAAPKSSCLAAAEDLESVRINDLVSAVRNSLDGCPEPTPTPIPTPCPDGIPMCGNGIVEDGEECDVGGICVGGANNLAHCTNPVDCPDGRCTTVGGQPTEGGDCAANCTFETARTLSLGKESTTLVQLSTSSLLIRQPGYQTLRSGVPRLDDTVDVQCETTFRAGDIPLVAKATDLQVEPVSLLTLYCLCVVGLETPSFGAGNSAAGRISCGGPHQGINYLLTQDYDSKNPSRPFAVPGCSHTRDPECDDVTEVAPGVFSMACPDITSPGCETGAAGFLRTSCRSPLEIKLSGVGPPGSAFIHNRSVIRWLRAYQCTTSLGGMDPCPEKSYGPDCLPCTDDDIPDFETPNGPWTTGTARGVVYNAHDFRGYRSIDEGSGTPCNQDAQCPGHRCASRELCLPNGSRTSACALPCGSDWPCRTVQTGKALNCDAFGTDQGEDGFRGSVFASCSPAIARFGGSVICSRYVVD